MTREEEHGRRLDELIQTLREAIRGVEYVKADPDNRVAWRTVKIKVKLAAAVVREFERWKEK